MICCVMFCIPASGLLKILKGHSFCKFPLLYRCGVKTSPREKISPKQKKPNAWMLVLLCVKENFPLCKKISHSLIKKICSTEKIYRGFPSLERNALQKIESASGDLSFFCFQSHLSVYMLFKKV